MKSKANSLRWFFMVSSRVDGYGHFLEACQRMSDMLQLVVRRSSVNLRRKLESVSRNDKLKHIGHSLSHSFGLASLQSSIGDRQCYFF